MPSLGSKKDIHKSDLNFFAEFTASAAKMTRMLGYGVVVGIVVVALIVGVIIWGIIRNSIAQSKIDELNTILNSEEYKNLDAESQQLTQQMNSYNNYFYSLSQLRGQVDTTRSVAVNLTDLIKSSIPSDSYVDNYDINQNTMHIEGYTFSYYSALNLVKMLNKTGLFATPVTLTVARVDPSTVGTVDTFIQANGKVNAINNYYSFIVDGALTRDIYLKVSKFLKTNDQKVETLAVDKPVPLKQGDPYEVKDVAKFTQSNKTYTLTEVRINKSTLAPDTLKGIVDANVINGTAYSTEGTIEIQLYYSLVEAAPEEGGNT